jgi:uncharacterized protein DUF4142
MIDALALMLLAAAQPQEQTTMPRQLDPQPYEQRDDAQGKPTDPLFDRKLVATDDANFIVSAVETVRQSSLDARGVEKGLPSQSLRDTAAAIGRQNDATTQALEALAKRKGWRLPEANPVRASTLPPASPHRTGANFVVSQISVHEQTLAQFRAQIAGKGDPELRRALKTALPGYEKNLQRLLEAKLQ